MFGPRNCGQIDSAEAFDDIKKLLKAVIINMTNRVFVLGIILIYDVLILANEPYGFLNTKENTLFQAQIVFKQLGC